MNGRLLLVSGLSGAGKTTLIAAALERMPELTYLRTFTTRPMRDGEGISHEYIFVSPQEYEVVRSRSDEWDHTEYMGHFYGADAGNVKQALGNGQDMICAVAPDLTVIDEMAKLYSVTPITIWIKTPPDIARQRIFQDDIRDARNEDFALSTNFDYIFEPTGAIQRDVDAFDNLLRRIISQ